MSPFLEFNSDFSTYGGQHLIAVFIIITLAVGLPKLTKRYLDQKQHLWLARVMSIIIATWVMLYILILIYLDKFNFQTDLPLDICNVTGLLLPFLMWKPNQRFFPYLYFYILAGTTQAVVNPHLFNGFPNFIFLKYWIVHGGLIVYIIYMAVIWKFSIRLKTGLW